MPRNGAVNRPGANRFGAAFNPFTREENFYRTRRFLQKRLNAATGMCESFVFDGLADFIKDHDHGRFRILTDGNGPQDGHGHQGIHVKDKARQVTDPFDKSFDAA